MPSGPSPARVIPGVSRSEGSTVDLELRRILVVDEALPVRRKLSEMLHRTGVPGGQIRAVATTEDAMECFALEHPDLVFTELLGADGAEGVEMVREMLALDPQARLVLVTAEPADSPLVRQCVRMGVFAVVEKPLRHEKIRAVLTEIENEDGGVDRFR